ncbi:MAG: phosphodiester glycosidase family protein [Phycisphaerae bacterium]|nr:phosphodiester glycosidase family protein [Phycisphaerae bacterium]
MSISHFRSAVVVLLVFIGSAARAEFPTSQPFPGITYRLETQELPPMRKFIATVDLTDPRVHIRVVPGGPDPDGPGRWQTTTMLPTAIAAREDFDLVINGDFFQAKGVRDAEGSASPYVPDLWAVVLGPAVTDGKVWSALPESSKNSRDCFIVHRDSAPPYQQRFAIESIKKLPSDAWQVVGGGPLVVKEGQLVPIQKLARHPRTALGLDKEGQKLTILVVDGRRPGVSVGMTFAEIGQEMLRLGCWQALNIDGGGSSIMAMRDPQTKAYKILNTPSDGRERAVANVLGIHVDRRSNASQPATSPSARPK